MRPGLLYLGTGLAIRDLKLHARLRELWVSDGTPEGTLPLATNEMLNSSVYEPTKVGDQAFFTDAHGRLWVTDSTPDATLELRRHECQLSNLTALGERLLYIAGDAQGTELWASDGTASGTVKVTDLPYLEPFFAPGRCLLPEVLSTSSPERLFLYVGDVLLTSDGTHPGTRTLFRAEDFCPAPHCLVASELAAIGDDVYLVVRRKDVLELWRIDAATAERVLLRSFADPGRFPPVEVGLLTEVGERLFFRAATPEQGSELWMTDGTAEGTRIVRDVNQGADGSDVVPLVALGEQLVFFADDGRHGDELWISDGSVGRTFLLRDVYPGVDSSFPHATSVEGVLLFTADDGRHGAEIWVSDGSPGGTRLFADLAEGAISSSPGGYVAAGDQVFFHVSGPGFRRGLWAFPRDLLPAPAPPFDPPCPEGFACLNDGRFQVEIRWWNQHAGGGGYGQPLPFSDESALFWFFKPTNVEVLVKVLDGRRLNGHFWVFATGLTDLYFQVAVLDVVTGETRFYDNPAGEICGHVDTTAFADP